MWENQPRWAAGQALNDATFMGRLVHGILFYDLPSWAFTAMYVGFFLLVVATLLLAPPPAAKSRGPDIVATRQCIRPLSLVWRHVFNVSSVHTALSVEWRHVFNVSSVHAATSSCVATTFLTCRRCTREYPPSSRTLKTCPTGFPPLYCHLGNSQNN